MRKMDWLLAFTIENPYVFDSVQTILRKLNAVEQQVSLPSQFYHSVLFPTNCLHHFSPFQIPLTVYSYTFNSQSL